MNKELDTITLQAMRRSSVQFFEDDFTCTFGLRQQNISGNGGGGQNAPLYRLTKYFSYLR